MSQTFEASLCGTCLQCLTAAEHQLPDVPLTQLNCKQHATFTNWYTSIDLGCSICRPLWKQMRPTEQARIKHYTGDARNLTEISFVKSEKHGTYIDMYVSVVPSSLQLSRSNRHFLLVPSETINNRAICASTTTIDALPLAREWSDQCISSHAECARPGNGWIPTRLLDVSSHLIRLVLREEVSAGENYMTMSHCWGDAKFYKLTHESFPNLRQGIRPVDLPLSFQQAIQTTQYFGITYLWIDALCIIQDEADLKDWLQEALAMDRVYSGSYLNISATASKDSSGGLFFNRPSRELEPCYATLSSSNQWNPGIETTYLLIDVGLVSPDFNGETIHSRGWVYQERLLSPRVIHFCSQQVFWECRMNFACEVHRDTIPTKVSYNLKTDFYRSMTDLTFQSLVQTWHFIVERFSQCSLTYASDKLPAIAGIVNHMQQQLKDEYIVGFWRGFLLDSLAWEATSITSPNGQIPASKPSVYRAPTWSWLSLDGHIRLPTPNFNSTRFFSRILDVQIQYKGSDATGMVEGGLMYLFGPICPVLNASPDVVEQQTVLSWKLELLADAQVWSTTFWPDIPGTNVQELCEKGALYSIHIYHEVFDNGPGEEFFFEHRFLMLRCVEQSKGIYERAGIVWNHTFKEPFQVPAGGIGHHVDKSQIPHHDFHSFTGLPIIIIR